MPFDLERLVQFCVTEIQRFAENHQNEVFYAFAIDANMLCLNSEQASDSTLKEYQERWDRRHRHIASWDSMSDEDLREDEFLLWLHERYSGLNRNDEAACLAVINDSRAKARKKGNPYRTPDGIRTLRDNTGDWKYQGFADMTAEFGFDDEAYNDHYYMGEEEQRTSEYGLAMDELIRRLHELHVFSVLRRSPDFSVSRVEHD